MCECCGGDCRLTSGYTEDARDIQPINPPTLSDLGKKLLQEDLDWVNERSGINPDLLGERKTPMCAISRIQDIGRAKERLKMVLDDDLFEGLGKRDPYWQSHSEEDDEKLHSIRCKLHCLHDNLWDIMQILRYGREE